MTNKTTSAPEETIDGVNQQLEKARAELEAAQAGIIRTKALAEVELRLQTERHTKTLAAEYQRVMESAVIAKKEADDYAKSVRAIIDEEARVERQRRVDETKGHAMKITQLGKSHREIMKQYAAEERELRAGIDRLVEDKEGQLEARFAKASKFLAGIEQALDMVANQILGARLKPLVPVYIPDNKSEAQVQ